MILIFILHFIGDFVLQPEIWAKTKYRDNRVLAFHAVVYSFVFSALFAVKPVDFVFKFIVLTFIFHFITDFFTSKWSHNEYEKKSLYISVKSIGFWTVIGFDQLLHMIQLYLCYQMIN